MDRSMITPSGAETGYILGYLGQYYSCWCPGSLRHRGISTHDIDWRINLSSMTKVLISITCAISVLQNDRKPKYDCLLQLQHHKGRYILQLPRLSDLAEIEMCSVLPSSLAPKPRPLDQPYFSINFWPNFDSSEIHINAYYSCVTYFSDRIQERYYDIMYAHSPKDCM